MLDYNALELIGDRPDNSCLELVNQFEDAVAWKRQHELILSQLELRRTTETRILKNLSIGTASRLSGCRLIWNPIVQGEELIGVGLIVLYPSEPRIAQNPYCRDEFLRVCHEQAGLNYVWVVVEQGYALACTRTDGTWRMETAPR